jgi:hypothetical protein
MNIAELVRFKNDLELSPEAFAGMTGFSFNRIRRGRVQGEVNLSPEQLATIGRGRRLHTLALELCGNQEAALEWIYAPAPSLGKRSPIELTITDLAFARVERLIATLKNAAQPVAAAPASGEPLLPPAPVAKAEAKVLESKEMELPGSPKDVPPPAARTVPVTKAELLPAISEPKPDKKFRITERFKEARARTPGMTKAEIARRMTALGFDNFTGAKLGRYEIGYEASWREITALASILDVKPDWLAQLGQAT